MDKNKQATASQYGNIENSDNYNTFSSKFSIWTILKTSDATNRIIHKSRKLQAKRAISLFEILTFFISTFAFAFIIASATTPLVSSQTTQQTSQATVCCEKTKTGAFCQNTQSSECEPAFRQAPASCESTSFCRQGCCFDSVEGTCSEQVPEKICQDSKGVWADNKDCDIPQCQQGCCILGKQASFVSLTRCKKLSSFFGLQTDFRQSVKSEAECIAVAENEDEGACVFEVDFAKTCKFTTRANCKNPVSQNGTITSNTTFHKDFLCSAEELATNCGLSTKTTCVAGKDEVYFVDTCNNPANIYDASKVNDKLYWKKVVKKVDSCGASSSTGNGNSASCGNCDYIAGSICSAFDRKKDKTQTTFGDNICRNLNCKNTVLGKSFRHGESFCVYDGKTGNGLDSVGSRQWKHICYAGEEIVEPCADFRNEQCVEDFIPTQQGSFSQAACRVNRWQDCASQEDQNDCENKDKRDCRFIETKDVKFLTAFGNVTTSGEKRTGICLPDVKPGVKFWESGDAEGVCALGNAQCVIKFEKGILTGKEATENKECLKDDWNQTLTDICGQISDCTGAVSVANDIKTSTTGFNFGPNAGVTTGRIIAEIEAGSNIWSAMKKAFGFGEEEVLLAPQNYEIEYGDFKSYGLKFESKSNKVLYHHGVGDGDAGYQDITELLNRGYKLEKVDANGGSKFINIIPPDSNTHYRLNKFGNDVGLVDISDINKIAITLQDALKKPLTLEAETSSFSSSQPALFTQYDKNKNKNLDQAELYELSRENPNALKLFPTLAAAAVPQGFQGKKVLGLFETKGAFWGGSNGLWIGYLSQGILWGGVVAGIVQAGGRLFGLQEQAVNAASAALFAGIASGNLAYGLLGTTQGTQGVLGSLFKLKSGSFFASKGFSFGIGAAVAVAVFILMYKKETTKTLTFQCKPFEPKIGGSDCELCNNDKFRPCSEYRCRSLGQACQLLNSGTGNETCAFVNPRDVTSPTISPFADILTPKHAYRDVKVRPPGLGMKIVNTERTDGCLKAFTPLQFGISTNEPTQCKIDFNHTRKFEDMGFFFGESNLFLYNHTQTLKLPSRDSLSAEGPIVPSDGTFTLYSRCRDANGNVNEDEFAIRFCVEQEPDTTPPSIEGTSINNNQFVQFNLNETPIEFYINEPADCKWSRQDKDFKLMENTMSCQSFGSEVNNNLVFTCRTTLFGLENRKDNNFFIRCKDKPTSAEKDRNIMSDSFEFTLKGTEPLHIIDVKPNGTIRAFSSVAPVTLEATTSDGASQGDSTCFFSQTGQQNDFISFFTTGTNKHSQTLNLIPGNYNISIKCVDLGGNADTNNTIFTLEIDQQVPKIARFYNEKGVSLCTVPEGCLKVITDEKTSCSFSNSNCNFEIKDGVEMPFQNSTEHFTDWKTGKTFFIRCRDTSGNEPSPRSCTTILKTLNQPNQQ